MSRNGIKTTKLEVRFDLGFYKIEKDTKQYYLPMINGKCG